MKKNLLIVILSSVMLMSITILNAQNPTFTCTIGNAKIVSDNEYEFDIVIKRTGTLEFFLSHFQVGIMVNPDLIPAGATVKVASVLESSGLLKAQQPAPEKFTYDPKKNVIRITPVPPSRQPNATTINQLEPGTVLCRVKVTSSLPFNKGVSTKHTWCFSHDTGYATKFFAWTSGPMFRSTDVTVQSSFRKSATTPADVEYTK